MNILGFDTSTAAAAACVVRSDGEAFELEPEPGRLSEPPAHARELLPAVDGVMRDAGLRFEDIDALAVGTGPGSFTGLRVGIATARSLAHATAAPVRPVSSLAVLAEGLEAHVRLPLIDARRGEVFGALWVGAELRWPAFVSSPGALLERLRSEPETARRSPLSAGDGSLRFREALEAAGIEVAPGGSRLHVVRALHLCRLAPEVPAVPPEAVVPTYLRAPDAKPAK